MTLSVIHGGYTDTLTSGTTEYCGVQGGYTWNTTESNTRQAIACAGTLKRLYVVLTAAPVTGSFAFMLRLNNADSSLTVTIATSATYGSIKADVTIAANDYVDLRYVPTSPGTVSEAEWFLVFDSTVANYTPLMMGCNGSTTPTTGTVYNTTYGCNLSWSDHYSRKMIFPVAGTLRDLYINLGSTVDPGGITLTFTVNYSTDPATSGSSTGITCAIAAGSLSGSDTTHTFSVTAGDMILISCAVSGGTATGEVFRGGLVFIPSTPGWYIAGHNSGASVNGTNINSTFSGYGNWTSGVHHYDTTPIIMIRSMYLHRYGSPGAGTSFKIQLEANDTLVTEVLCTLSGTNQTTNVTGLRNVITEGSSLTLYSLTMSGSPTWARGSEVFAIWFGITNDVNGVVPFKQNKINGVARINVAKINGV